jgi:hypothetical protein
VNRALGSKDAFLTVLLEHGLFLPVLQDFQLGRNKLQLFLHLGEEHFACADLFFITEGQREARHLPRRRSAVIAAQLFACAAKAGNSEHKRAYFIDLPDIVLALAQAIAEQRYQPKAFTVFAVSDPKLREIFAPAFADRLAQQWLVKYIKPCLSYPMMRALGAI